MTPRTVEEFAQRIEAMGFMLDGLPLPSPRNPDAFHERKGEIRREFRRIAVDFRNTFGAVQGSRFPEVSREFGNIFGPEHKVKR